MRVVFFIAVAVSVVHYTDNSFNYAEYPVPASGPAPSQTLIGLAWFAFTAFGIAAYAQFDRGNDRVGALLMAVYSGSGLVGLGHYTVDMGGQPWWRHAHIVADILCGVALLALSLRRLRAYRIAP